MTSEMQLQVVSSDPGIFVHASTDSDDDPALGWAESGLIVRRIRGGKMTKTASFMDEISAAMQFPTYFGFNGNALRDCLTDLSWLPTHTGYALLITSPELAFANEVDGDALQWFVDVMTWTKARWATAVELGEWWDRPALPFSVVLVTDIRHEFMVKQRWSAAGAVWV